MASIVMPVWQQDDIQQAATDIDTLNQKLREYSMASEADKPGLLADLNEITAGMDEGALIEYIGLLTQIQSLLDSGLTEAEIEAMFPEIDVSGAMEQLASVQDYLDTHQLELPGLASMFSEAIPEEALKIATDLDMTGAQARWNEFAANPGVITTDAIIASYQENEETQKIQPTVEAFVSGYTEIPEGADVAQLTPQGVIAYVEKYADVTTGADVSGLTPEIAACFVAGYQELAEGADVSLLKPSDVVAYVTNYAEEQGVDISGLAPDGVTAFVMAHQEIEGGALTTTLKPSDVAAIVTQYLLDENVDLSKVTDAQVDAMVTAYAEAANCDKTVLKAEVVAQITEYVQAEGLKPPILTTKVQITGYEYLTYQDFQENSGLSVQVPVRLGEVSDTDLAALSANGKIKVWQDGIEIPVTAVPEGAITADTIATMDEDGTMHILISPQVTGTQEAIEAISPLKRSSPPVHLRHNAPMPEDRCGSGSRLFLLSSIEIIFFQYTADFIDGFFVFRPERTAARSNRLSQQIGGQLHNRIGIPQSEQITNRPDRILRLFRFLETAFFPQLINGNHRFREKIGNAANAAFSSCLQRPQHQRVIAGQYRKIIRCSFYVLQDLIKIAAGILNACNVTCLSQTANRIHRQVDAGSGRNAVEKNRNLHGVRHGHKMPVKFLLRSDGKPWADDGKSIGPQLLSFRLSSS